ncbi:MULTISPECIES: L,D-transpeptidase family protein [Paenibacillus]|uniref:L,D-transpeptidase family protein n=1 Tax=Paenibacillus TaxID=44249 RepID=UPI002FE0199B
MSNSAYLKKYVENHPKNKMAWYLLGKEYEASGQEGKAHYCYIQAGSVYEAFESSKVPADLWKEYQENLLRESMRKEKQAKLWRKIGLALMLLLLLWMPSAQAPGSAPAAQSGMEENGPGQDPPGARPESDPSAGQSGKNAGDETGEAGSYTAKPYFGDPKRKHTAMAELLTDDTSTAGRETAVLGMVQSGRWSIWSKDMPVVYGVARQAGTGRTTLQSYDAKACQCTPPDASGLRKGALAWIERQESLAALSSAMRHYKEKEGHWPESLKSLTGAFPDNWLAGSDPVMEKAFQPLLTRLKKGAGTEAAKGDDGAHPAKDQAAALSEADPYFTKPLEVIVDTANHRLAVVSGDVMLRSYKVGLGGERTPHGVFRITDKVMNPNGRDNGEFGSRGMQLSETNYAIHGTNEPDSIGKDESLGCVRMTKKDVEELFDLVPKGTKVTIGKGILPKLESVPEERFKLGSRQDQTNPQRTYHWLN